MLFSLTGVALRGPRVPPGGDDHKRESETCREFSGVPRPHSCTHETQRHQFELHDGKRWGCICSLRKQGLFQGLNF